MITKEELRQIVREEIGVALMIGLVPLAERIEKAIFLASSGNSNRSECISAPIDHLPKEAKVPK